MSIDLKVYDNGDHTCLVWLPADEKPIPNCRGFAIQRIYNRQKDGEYLHGGIGFSDDDKLDPKNPWKFPIQRYMWWDYTVKIGDTVQYRVVPVIGSKSNLKLADNLASDFTPEMTISGQCTDHLSAYFNKGIVATQWVSRDLLKNAQDSLKTVISKPNDPLRNELSGLLRPQILNLLSEAKKNKGKIFAALYELNDPELLDGLTAFGDDCNLILANGAFKPPDNDENKAVRAKLKNKIRVYDRLVTGNHFAHNKFVVFCDADGKPQKVLTGSTNWTMTGLCTQANNGLIIDDAAVAQDFLDAWNRYHLAGNDYPDSLAASNSELKSFQVDGSKVTPWFVPTRHTEDMDYARKLINAAKDGILFLFFNPGGFEPPDQRDKWTLLQEILFRHHEEGNAYYNPNLYLKGVVNQEIPYLTEGQAPTKGQKPPDAHMDPTAPVHPVALYTGGIEPPDKLTQDLVVPLAIKQKFSTWQQEDLGSGVHIHSKVIVLDPFGENPVVMTGSHNLGVKASSKNDDNLVIIEGNRPLAAAYAVNIIAIFQNYHWNSYANKHAQNPKDPKTWHGLQDNDTWQQGYMTGEKLAELNFWFGKEDAQAQPAVAVRAAAAGAGAGGSFTTVPQSSSAPPVQHRATVHRAAHTASTGVHTRSRQSGATGGRAAKAPAAKNKGKNASSGARKK
ncbi:MAG TPA: phospholipase D-like domain-containing protein [Candidatus Angelobacter sp.]|nr:phospholipase D-like domain-containing protein [Candidatus Angelobacter sp.]